MNRIVGRSAGDVSRRRNGRVRRFNVRPSSDGTQGNKTAPEGRVSGPLGTDSESSVHEAVAVLPQVLKIVGSVVAPTTLLTALLFYFGRLHAQGLTRYLRVHFTVFDFTVQDYLVRSADGLFLPVTIAAAVALLSLWIHRLLLGALPVNTRTKVLQVLAPLAGVSGMGLVALALAAMFGNKVFASFPEAGGLSLSIGVLLLAYADRLLRSLIAERRSADPPWSPAGGIAVAEWGAIFILVSVGLFWAVNSYAIGVGTSRGQQIERGLESSADVVLYSEKSLDLHVPGVREMICSTPENMPEAAYRFRYEGLKFVLQSGDHYLFLPKGWMRDSGVALVIPRSDALRLEFSSPGQGVRGDC